MHTNPAHTRVDYDEQDSPERPRVSTTLDRIRKQCEALDSVTSSLASRLEAVLLADDSAMPTDRPQPRQPAPPLVESLDDLLDNLASLTRRIDSLGDRVAL